MRAYRAAIIAIILGLLAVAALVIAVECGGDDKPSVAPTIGATAAPTIAPTADVELTPYFQGLDTIFQRASDDSVTADATLQTALSDAQDIEATKAAYATFLTSTESVFETAIAAMNGLQVPPAAQEGHSSFIAAAESSKVLAAELRDSIAGVTTEAELETLLEDFGADKGPLLEEADQACSQLQETATARGIDIDLACTGG